MRSGLSRQCFADRLPSTAHRPRALAFISKIGFGVDVGGIDRDMAEPCADGVDVDAGAEKMRSGRVADGMRADPFFAHFRDTAHGSLRISRHDLMDAEACQWLRATTEEHWFFADSPGDEVSQDRGRGGP